MRRILSVLLIVFIITGMCACGRSENNTKEESANMKEEIAQMAEHAVGEGESVSVAANMDENGEITDYIDVCGNGENYKSIFRFIKRRYGSFYR